MEVEAHWAMAPQPERRSSSATGSDRGSNANPMKKPQDRASFPVRLVMFLVAWPVCGLAVPAQCANLWLPGEGVPGVSGAPWSTEAWTAAAWDRDGAGPATPVLVVAGTFRVAGTSVANMIAAWDPATGTWSALGSGMNETVFALTTMPNGDLVAGGRFTFAGGVSANSIARWNGASWSALGSGTSNAVLALTALPNGDLVAGGRSPRRAA